ncbi:hydroxyacid dehydrogenase [Granulosicoccus sp. 3-233]|uniref:hydroxyacid dehydrogenase n=1 Tax=Granulosicoccus sp. 3-233 TaxID=3417969 RepID=UPI003D33B10F
MLNALIQLPERSVDVHLDKNSKALLNKVCQSVDTFPASADDSTLLDSANVLITGWGSDLYDINEVQKIPNLALIAHLGGSVKSVVTRDVIASGVRVTQAASVNARPVAEFTLASILLHCKQVRGWEALYREQRSSINNRTAALSAQVGIRSKVIGIVGASRIGRRVIDLLAPHGVQILLHDPFVNAEEATQMGVETASLDELMARSDVISLHQPLLPSTVKSIGREQFSLMRDDALLINTARGRLVDHDALIETLSNRPIHAILDVTDPEPLPDNSPLWDLPNVQLTPHIAGSMGEEVAEMTALVIEEIDRFGRGEPLQHEVTLEDWDMLA